MHNKYLKLTVMAAVAVSIVQATGLCFAFKNTFNKQASSKHSSGILFTRIQEPRENAFSMLVPKGWQVEGGIVRVNAAQVGGPLNAIEAKCDMMIKSDDQGSVSFRIFPDIVYGHVGIGGGFWGPGQYYQGAEVKQIVDAKTFLSMLFSGLHPNAVNVQILKSTQLPGEKQSLDHGLSYLNQMLARIGLQSLSYQSDAAGMAVDYTEGGTRYREVLVTGIVNMPAAMTWKNTRTLIFRAPASQFNQWRAVADIMRFSVQFSMQWFLKEAGGQAERAKIAQKVYQEIQRIDREIVARTTINREEIMNDNYLVLTGQEEFVDPHTNQVEMDTDYYRYRWKTDGGDIYYTNNEGENPNLFLHQTDFKLTPVRKRRNE